MTIMTPHTSSLSAAFVTAFCVLLVFLTFIHDVHAASADDWRGRQIYQVVTDRYAQTDGSTTKACNTQDQVYCGGTFQGIIKKLDYIQGMGFNAVRTSIDDFFNIMTYH